MTLSLLCRLDSGLFSGNGGRRRSPEYNSDGTYPSSADSDYAMSPLPPLNENEADKNAPVEDRLMGHLVPPPTRGGIRFPPISTSNSLPSRLPKPAR